jgi:hypothetical protein
MRSRDLGVAEQQFNLLHGIFMGIVPGIPSQPYQLKDAICSL